MEVKIAHCADIHIGAGHERLDKFSDLRRAEIKNTFFNMLNTIDKNNVDILLIAGDLFHDISIYNSDVKDVKKAMGDIKSKVVISPGNHDPFTVDSPYCSKWPDNVYIFKNNYITNFEFKELKARVWGSAFTDSNNSGVRINQKIDKNDSFINIMVTHGTCLYGKTDIYNPIKVSDICESGMNYIALGHIHKRTPILHEGKTFYAYCGCLEGRSFKEVGEKGFYLGTVSDKDCKLDFVRMAKRLYLEIEMDITGLQGSNDIYAGIIEKIKNKTGKDYKSNIYKINFVGILKENDIVDIDYIESRLKEDVFFAEICDETEIYIDDNRKNLKSIFVRNMKNKIENCCDEKEKEIMKNALKFGILSFSREVFR